MLFARIRVVAVLGVAAIAIFAFSARAEACSRCRPAAVTAMSPVCCTTPPPYHSNRLMWTPQYGITSTCNPFVARTCGYGIQACAAPRGACGAAPVSACAPAPMSTFAMSPVAACDPCAPAAMTTTTFRPFLWRLFHPFRPLVPTTSYRVAFCSPVAPCPTAACAPVCPTPCLPACPAPSCGPACAPAVGAAMGSAMGTYDTIAPSCPSGTCGPMASEASPSLSAPSLSAPSIQQGGEIPRTFKDESQPLGSPEMRMRATPDAGTDQPSTRSEPPRLIDPVARNHASPIHPATYLVPISRPAPVKTSPVSVPAQRSISVGGWRASHD